MDQYTREADEVFVFQNPNVFDQMERNRSSEFMLELFKFKSKTDDLIRELRTRTLSTQNLFDSTILKHSARDITLNPFSAAEIQSVSAAVTHYFIQFPENYYTKLQNRLWGFIRRFDRKLDRLEREIELTDTPSESWNKIMDPDLSRHVVLQFISSSRGLSAFIKDTLATYDLLDRTFRTLQNYWNRNKLP